MAHPLRVLLSVGGFAVLALVLVVLAVVASREAGERERFIGQPCRESTEEPPTPTDALVSPGPVTETSEALPALPSPERALGGERPLSGAEAALASRYEPILEVAKSDRFWPVPVPVVFDLRLGERFTRFIGQNGSSDHARLTDLQPGEDERQYLDYPAKLDHVEDEFCSVGAALHIPAIDLAQWNSEPDLLHPNRSAQFYFLRRPNDDGGVDLQYWFFYPLNYLPTLTEDSSFLSYPIAAIKANTDFHEGDFEHVTVELQPRATGLEPVAVTMARHSNEDRTFAWDAPALQRVGDHPVVYAGFGGHASYNKCGLQLRHANGFLPLIDWTLCGEERNFSFGTETPLVDLRSVPWACWPGHFGELPPTSIALVFEAGPRSPLFQAGNAGFGRALCSRH